MCRSYQTYSAVEAGEGAGFHALKVSAVIPHPKRKTWEEPVSRSDQNQLAWQRS